MGAQEACMSTSIFQQQLETPDPIGRAISLPKGPLVGSGTLERSSHFGAASTYVASRAFKCNRERQLLEQGAGTGGSEPEGTRPIVKVLQAQLARAILSTAGWHLSSDERNQRYIRPG